MWEAPWKKKKLNWHRPNQHGPRIDPFTSHAQIYVSSNVDNVADSEKPWPNIQGRIEPFTRLSGVTNLFIYFLLNRNFR